ncbi:hypothetical protein MMC30_003982 [Trapelia coarctata]|nr:hypothetical protein [Trapelia coarctata]
MAWSRWKFPSFSTATQARAGADETDPFLTNGDPLEHGQWASDPACTPNPHAHLPVYNTIHQIRQEIIKSVDDPYSLEQLRSPRINVEVVRPLVDRLHDMQDISVVYCLLVNRVQFLREQTYWAHQSSVNITRAVLCEIVANRVLRRFDEDNPEPRGVLVIANVLVAGFNPFQGAPEEVLEENRFAFPWLQRKGGYEGDLTALELGIISDAKHLLSSSACQKVVDAIYQGRVVYTPSSFIDILPDRYKHKLIQLYNPGEAPLLNQYRLIVPRTRNFLEICQFVILLVLYLLVLEHRDSACFTVYELGFCVYASGWALDQIASMLEHGWQVYTQNLWSFLDVIFIIIYGAYFTLRMHGIATDDVWFNQQAIDVLCIAAPVLVPRLGFNLMSENMLFVSLRAMVANFTLLTFLATWCFGGFLLAMKWLSNGAHTPITISKWMLWVWFGLDGTGIQRSIEFHWLLGPILMVTFAFLGNTLFLTILVSMLSKTFSDISSNASAEIQFRRAVLTFEGVKSDALFSYQPPFNVLALLLLLPLKFAVSPRWFHKINVAATRTINAPLLLLISLYERRSLWRVASRNTYGSLKPRSTLSSLGFSRFSVHGDIQAVFDSEPPQPEDQALPEVDDRASSLEESLPAVNQKLKVESESSSIRNRGRPRKDSVEPLASLAEHLPGLLHRLGGGNDTKSRLEALEESTTRIEEMLRKLCERAETDDSDEDAGSPAVLARPIRRATQVR